MSVVDNKYTLSDCKANVLGVSCDSAGTDLVTAALSRCSSISSFPANSARAIAASASRFPTDCKHLPQCLNCTERCSCVQPEVSLNLPSPCEHHSLTCEELEGGSNSEFLTVDHALPVASGSDEDLMSMLRSLRALEEELRPSADYMLAHGSESQYLYIDADMRQRTVSWLVEVSCDSRLHQETLFLAISLLDRFLSATSGVPRDVLQLLSMACLLIAAKYEEEMHPSVPHLTRMADHCFKENDLLQMERTVLTSLEFRMMPTAYTFWSVYRMGYTMHNPSASLASYLMELAQLEYSFLQYNPSLLAAAALVVAEAHTGMPGAAANMEQYLFAVTGYTVDSLQDCSARLLRLQQKASLRDDSDLATSCGSDSTFLPVIEKYACQDWSFSSLVPPQRIA